MNAILEFALPDEAPALATCLQAAATRQVLLDVREYLSQLLADKDSVGKMSSKKLCGVLLEMTAAVSSDSGQSLLAAPGPAGMKAS